MAMSSPLEMDADRSDYLAVLAETGVTHEQVRAWTENREDMIEMPPGVAVEVRGSPIEGLGLFAKRAFRAGEPIAPARIGANRTPAGRFTNHAKAPNARPVVGPARVTFVALRDLRSGDEVTVDYRDCRQAAMELDAQMGFTHEGGR